MSDRSPRWRAGWWLVGLLVAGALACGGDAALDLPRERMAPESPALIDAPVPTASRSSERSDDSSTPLLVVLGDSLTAGLGLAPHEAYPARLQAKLDAAGYRLRVVSAGESGGTSAGGLRRLEWTLGGHDAPVVALLVALGGNDGLRGLPVTQLKENLATIVTTALGRNVAVVLAGMEAPPNFGSTYTTEFRQVYRELADEHDVIFVPFLLEGVAGVAELNQPDGIHPNAEGAERVANHLWPAVETLAHALVGAP